LRCFCVRISHCCPTDCSAFQRQNPRHLVLRHIFRSRRIPNCVPMDSMLGRLPFRPVWCLELPLFCAPPAMKEDFPFASQVLSCVFPVVLSTTAPRRCLADNGVAGRWHGIAGCQDGRSHCAKETTFRCGCWILIIFGCSSGFGGAVCP